MKQLPGYEEKHSRPEKVHRCRNCGTWIFFTRRDPAFEFGHIFDPLPGQEKGKNNTVAYNAFTDDRGNMILEDPISGWPHLCRPCIKNVKGCCDPPVMVVKHPGNETRPQFWTNASGQHIKEHKAAYRYSKLEEVTISENVKPATNVEDWMREHDYAYTIKALEKLVSEHGDKFSELTARVEKLDAKLQLIYGSLRSLADDLA